MLPFDGLAGSEQLALVGVEAFNLCHTPKLAT